MDNKLKIENVKSQISELCFKMVGKDADEKYEMRQEINLLNDEIIRLEREDEEGDDVLVPVISF